MEYEGVQEYFSLYDSIEISKGKIALFGAIGGLNYFLTNHF